MTDIEKKAREYADKVHGIKRRNSDDWERSVEDFITGSQEGQREAFAAGVLWEMEHWDYLRNSGEDKHPFIEAGFRDYLSRKEGK